MDRIMTFVVVIVFTISVLCLFGYGAHKFQQAWMSRIEMALDGRVLAGGANGAAR